MANQTYTDKLAIRNMHVLHTEGKGKKEDSPMFPGGATLMF
jgi:hypothetical protein